MMHFSGIVMRGDGQATSLYSLPTANIKVEKTQTGVFTGRASYQEIVYPSLICIRQKDDIYLLEVHLFGYEGNLYGETLEVEVEEKIRDFFPFVNEKDYMRVFEDIKIAKEKLGLIP